MTVRKAGLNISMLDIIEVVVQAIVYVIIETAADFFD